MDRTSAPSRERRSETEQKKQVYRLVWRWHFYAGLYVIPFMLMLSITGLVMMLYKPVIEPLLYPNLVSVEANSSVPVSWTRLQQSAQQAFPDGSVAQLMMPDNASESVRFIVKTPAGENQLVFVDPYTAEVLGSHNKDNTLYAWADNIHGTFLLGKWGDGLIEISAGLTLVLLLTGAYMWWSRGEQQGRYRWAVNTQRKGRSWWREIHVITGVYVSLALFFFVLTGLSWTGVWGSKMVQPWNSFPAGVWSGVPMSDVTHASLNPGVHEEIPWNLEQTPMPASGSMLGLPGIPAGTPINLDTLVQFARNNGMTDFRINLPQSETGVYSLVAATMSGDTTDATRDRIIHIDRYTGNLLGDIGYEDYSLMAKAMALGIPLHMGSWTTANLVLNTVLCVLIILLCWSGVLLWWKRRPNGAKTLPAAPPHPGKGVHAKGLVLIWISVGVFVPLVGAVLLGLLVLDQLVVRLLLKLKTQPESVA